MKKLLFVAFLIFAGCDGSSEPTEVGDASVDSLPPVRPDTRADSTGAPCEATAMGTVVKPAGKIPYIVSDKPVTCEDPSYSTGPMAGLTCSQMVMGYQGTNGRTCCIPADTASWAADKLHPYCGEYVVIGYEAICSTTGKFVGWLCAAQ